MDQLHAVYLEEFADVRGDEIEDVAGRGGIFGDFWGAMSTPCSATLTNFGEIEDVDENFIEQIRPLLSANQVPTLDRVAARRDRVPLVAHCGCFGLPTPPAWPTSRPWCPSHAFRSKRHPI